MSRSGVAELASWRAIVSPLLLWRGVTEHLQYAASLAAMAFVERVWSSSAVTEVGWGMGGILLEVGE